MKIKLNRLFSGSTAVSEDDVLGLKNVLNRLGYYKPYKETGITAISDAGIFDSLRSFQKDWSLPVTGEIRPDDDTIQTINAALSLKSRRVAMFGEPLPEIRHVVTIQIRLVNRALGARGRIRQITTVIVGRKKFLIIK